MTEEEIIEEFMYPLTVFIVHVRLHSGVNKYYTFTEEESQQCFIEYLQENAENIGMESAFAAESILDDDPRTGQWLWTVH